MAQRFSMWHVATLVLLFVGYAGYYFCRTNLALAKTPLAEEFGPIGITTGSINDVASVAMIFYSVGKLVTGMMCDVVGGRVMFIGGMFASVALTLAFVAAPDIAAVIGTAWLLPLFILTFSINRFAQSTGWGALVKVASAWFSYQSYGRVMGILCISYLLGDSVVRLVFAEFLAEGSDWRHMFYTAAGILGVIGVLNLLFLRSRPADVGLETTGVDPASLFHADGDRERPASLWSVLRTYSVSPAFWLVLLMSVTLTFVRESSNFFNNDYLKAATGVDDRQAAIYSSYFPLFGALAVLATGFMTDKISKGSRGPLMVASLVLLLPVLWVMAYVGEIQGTFVPVILVCLVGFLSLAPYAFLTGAISLDLGGKQASATAAGILDAVGYAIGGVLGMRVQKILVRGDTLAEWQDFFFVMLVMVGITAVASAAYWYIHERSAARLRHAPAAK